MEEKKERKPRANFSKQELDLLKTLVLKHPVIEQKLHDMNTLESWVLPFHLATMKANSRSAPTAPRTLMENSPFLFLYSSLSGVHGQRILMWVPSMQLNTPGNSYLLKKFVFVSAAYSPLGNLIYSASISKQIASATLCTILHTVDSPPLPHSPIDLPFHGGRCRRQKIAAQLKPSSN
jgi:hypothetical protein